MQTIKNDKGKLLVGALLALVLVLGLGYVALASSGTVTVKFLENASGNLISGGPLTLEAIAPEGYEFDHWEVDNQSTDASPRLDLTMDGDRHARAVFVKPVTEVRIDIKPGSYPNCFNINGHGVIPVAILGEADFDVIQIDVVTLQFAGLNVRVKGNGTPQCSVEDVSGDFTYPEGAPDGYADRVCQFVDDADAWAPDDGTASLTGQLYDGTPIGGTDEICLRPPE